MKGKEEGSQLNTTESMKDFELKYMPMATQFFILPLLFPYFYELGLIFFFQGGTTLSPYPWYTDVASTAEAVVDGAAHGTPKEPCKELAWLQGCRIA